MAEGDVKWHRHFKICFLKVKHIINLSYDPAIPLKKNVTCSPEDLIQNAHGNIIQNRQKAGAIQCLSKGIQ